MPNDKGEWTADEIERENSNPNGLFLGNERFLPSDKAIRKEEIIKAINRTLWGEAREAIIKELSLSQSKEERE